MKIPEELKEHIKEIIKKRKKIRKLDVARARFTTDPDWQEMTPITRTFIHIPTGSIPHFDTLTGKDTVQGCVDPGDIPE